MNTNFIVKLNWEARCQELIKAINLLSETSVYSGREGCNIPVEEAWDFLEKAAAHYSSPRRVNKLKIPNIES